MSTTTCTTCSSEGTDQDRHITSLLFLLLLFFFKAVVSGRSCCFLTTKIDNRLVEACSILVWSETETQKHFENVLPIHKFENSIDSNILT